MKEDMRILVVDDERSIRKRCVSLLSREGYDAVGVGESLTALGMVRDRGARFDVMLIDIRMPGMDGIELLGKVKEIDPQVEIIMMTGYASVDTAVKAMKMGAYDYLPKPFEIDELLHVMRNVAEKRALQEEVRDLRRQLKSRQDRPLLFGTSQAMNAVSRFIRKVAAVDCNVLLFGESGTGKELVARAIHNSSPRHGGPFVVADCAALSGTLLESELFGHLKGAFTGAQRGRKGYFESAHEGTIFLDEIGELPLDLQGKLLRSVQERVVVKVGDIKEIRVDARIIAATNRDLKARVKEGAFREDLFYRLNVVSLTVPPLRERREDIPILIRHFLKEHASRLNLPRLPKISRETVEALARYNWPGNVRELENAVHRAVVLADDGKIDLEDLLPSRGVETVSWDDPSDSGLSFQELRRRVVRDFTRDYLEKCLLFHGGNITRAARTLGMRRTSLQRLIKQTGIDTRSFRGNESAS